jgi:hypothetical protein
MSLVSCSQFGMMRSFATKQSLATQRILDPDIAEVVAHFQQKNFARARRF